MTTGDSCCRFLQVQCPSSAFYSSPSPLIYQHHAYLATKLDDHPDQVFVKTLIAGLTNGFHTGITHTPTSSFTCTNLQSALHQPEQVTKLLQQELWLCHFSHHFLFRVHPLGFTDKHYSKNTAADCWPFSAPQAWSLLPEWFIAKEVYFVSYTSVNRAISFIKSFEKWTVMNKTDITCIQTDSHSS